MAFLFMEIINSSIAVLTRFALGWYFLHAGILKLLDPTWTSRGFLEHAAMFPDFYLWFTQPSILPVIDVLNAWGITAVGVGLLLGIGTRIAVCVGILLMALYYFPHDPGYTYIVDEHVFIALLLVYVLRDRHEGKWSGQCLLSSVGIHPGTRLWSWLQ